MDFPEEQAEMIQRDPALGGCLMEIELPERVLADLVAHFPDLIRIRLDPRVALIVHLPELP